jgi:hypothetical protein
LTASSSLSIWRMDLKTTSSRTERYLFRSQSLSSGHWAPSGALVGLSPRCKHKIGGGEKNQELNNRSLLLLVRRMLDCAGDLAKECMRVRACVRCEPYFQK